MSVALNVPLSIRDAEAQEAAIDPRSAVARLFDPGPVQFNWFASEFLAAVPAAQVDESIEALTADFGSFSGVQVEGTEGAVRLERALVPVSVTLDAQGRIAGLLCNLPKALLRKSPDGRGSPFPA
jgi:hypothetical protein